MKTLRTMSNPRDFSSRLVSRAKHNLWVLSGEDKYIIKDAPAPIQHRFTRISLVVAFIVLICFAGSFVFFEYAFDLPVLAEILLGLFVAAITGNLYVLLLYTITPIIFDKKKPDVFDKEKYTLFGALTIRVFFITLLAITMAQPASILILSRFTDREIDRYKQKYLNDSNLQIQNRLKERQLETTEKTILIENENKAVHALLESSHFFTKRLQILSDSNIFYWIINGLMWLLFFYPIYEKYNIRKQKRFYIQKREIENQIVLDEYDSFKHHYERIMEKRIAEYDSRLKHALSPLISSVETINPSKFQDLFHELFSRTEPTPFVRFEYWVDPPFRTIRKTDGQKIKPENDLLKLLYPEQS